MSLLKGATEKLISFQAHDMPASPQALDLAFTAILRRKGRVLDSLADTQATLRAHLTPQLRDKLLQLADASAQLSTSLHAPLAAHTAQGQRPDLTALRTRVDALEAELNTASSELRAQSESVTLAKIQAALPRGTALVEIARYYRFDARRIPDPWQEEHYAAYLLLRQGPPQWVALGEAARIDAGVDAVLAAMRRDASAGAARTALRELDKLVYAPLRDRLPGIPHVILSPDGKLNLVPFEALIDPQGRHAIEQQLISYVTSGRDLLRQAKLRMLRQPRFAHPYYWAAFIAAGDWTPLDKGILRQPSPTPTAVPSAARPGAEAVW